MVHPLEDSLTARIRTDEQHWVKAQRAAAEALALNRT
jgi:DNA-directed RNA polymerase subunit L